MHPLIIVTLLFGSQVVLCKPNNNQQLLASAQRTVASAADYDKQLIRKAIDETNLSATSNQGGNRNININSNSNSNINNKNEINSGSSSNNQDQSNRVDSQVITTLTTNNSALNFQCPEQFGYYTDTRDCTKYYVCVFGEVLHESCTGGLRFSRELQTCDWPRNVDCPQQQQQQLQQQQQQQSDENSSQTSSGNTSQPPTTTTAASITGPTLNNQQGSSLKHHHNHNQLVNNAKELSLSANDGSGSISSGSGTSEERSLKGSSSLVFADEGSDPQQPSFDEAISPVITVDGAIHLHDGSGGTFSLTPNHNRPIQTQTGRQQDSPNQSVDVFVKPLLTQQQSSGNQRQAKQLSSTTTAITTTSSSNLANNNNNNNNNNHTMTIYVLNNNISTITIVIIQITALAFE